MGGQNNNSKKSQKTNKNITQKTEKTVADKTSANFPERLKKHFPLSFIIAFVFDLIYGCLYYSQYNAIDLYDTASFSMAGETLATGKLDLLRTPVYPLFLHICSKSSIEDTNRLVVTIQIIIFYISIWFFYQLLAQFTSNPVLKAAGIIFYGCMTPVIAFNFLMLTESFTVSGSVFFCYLLVLAIKKRKISYYTICIFLALFMTMLRPSELYLFVVIAITAVPFISDLLRKKTETKKQLYLIPLAAFLICIASLFGYMSLNKRHNNYYGLSYVSEMNRFYDVVQADIWRDNSDTEIVNALQENLDAGNTLLGAALEVEPSFRNVDIEPDRIPEFNSEAISNHRSEYVYYLARKVLNMGYNHMEYNLSNDSYFFKDDANTKILWLGDLLDFNINFLYFIFLVTAIIIIAAVIKKKQILWPELTAALIIGGLLAVNILAGPAEFHRLNAPCYPFAILLLVSWAGAACNNACRLTKRKSTDDSKKDTV